MPALKPTKPTELYSAMDEMAKKLSESRDCTVKALAILAGVDYATAHATMAQAGRKKGKGAHLFELKDAFALLGFRMVQMTREEYMGIIAQYPNTHANAKNITTHHPRRYPKVWAQFADQPLLFSCKSHVAAFRDGQVHDWAVNRSLRVYSIHFIKPCKEEGK